MLKQLSNYILLMRLDKPVGIYLLLFPTLSAVWTAQLYNGEVKLSTVLIFTLGCILTRSAGCVINDYFDKDFDKYVTRTQSRPLAIQSELKNQALLLALGLFFASGLLVLNFNLRTIMLALCALVIACTYPLFKRFFAAPQAYLGIAFSMGIPMSYTAQDIAINWIMYILLIANILLVFAYDTIYALVDKDDDIKINIKTSAIFLGKYDITAIALCYIGYWALNLLIGYVFRANLLFWILYLLGVILTYINIKKTKTRDKQTCFAVFKANAYIVIINFLCCLVLFTSRHAKLVVLDFL